jgi:hypothetical protein
MATIIRKGDSNNLAGIVSEISAIRHQLTQVITAVRTQSNTLKLISWRLKDDSNFERTSPSAGPGVEAGEASSIDIARGAKYVTSHRAGNGRLTLTSWNITNEGAITRLRDSGTLAGEATNIKIVAISGPLFVTACRAGNGRLKLISWRVNNDGSFTRVGEREGTETVSEIWLTLLPTMIGGFRHLVTSVRAGNGILKLFVWNVTDAGVISPLGNSGTQAGEATMIRAVRESFVGHVITACRAGNGSLKLISWEISGNGDTVTRLNDSHTLAGAIGDNSLMSRPDGKLISAVRTAAGNLKLIGWKVDVAGKFTRTGDSEGQEAGAASLITLCQEGLGFEPARIVTGVRTASNTLKLISWAGA